MTFPAAVGAARGLMHAAAKWGSHWKRIARDFTAKGARDVARCQCEHTLEAFAILLAVLLGECVRGMQSCALIRACSECWRALRIYERLDCKRQSFHRSAR
jgi:hypothetical protein